MPVSANKSRRSFLKIATAAFAAPYVVPRHILGGNGFVSANDRVQVALIGCGVRGKYLCGNLPPEGRIVALCDFAPQAIESVLQPAKEFVEPLASFVEQDAAMCTKVADYRTMFDSRDIDAVIIAAPDHHHVLAGVLACQAGKDVYCEKPLSLTVAEGRVLVNAARKHQRVVQVGSQQRTMAVNVQGCEFLRNGGLGKITHVDIRNLPGPMPVENMGEEPLPAGLPWDLFCGPAALRAYHRNLWIKDAFKFGYLTWRGWDLFRDYSGHLMTNWGGHSLDMLQLALGMDHTGPVEFIPQVEAITGGEDDGESRFNTLLDDQWHDKTPPLGTLRDRKADAMRFCPVTFRYANGVEVRMGFGLKQEVYHAEKGSMTMTRNRFAVTPEDLAPLPLPVSERERWKGEGHVARPHLANWIECIKTRGSTNAPVEAGHRTATICHLINIARELGRPLKWNPDSERFVNDPAADALLDRPRRKGWELPTV